MKEMNTDWIQRGYALVSDLFDIDRIARFRTVCERIRTSWLNQDPLTGIGTDDPETETCLRHLIHPSYFEGQRDELRDLLQLFADPTLLEILRSGWNEEPVFRSTTLFFSPISLAQEGAWHRDSQFVFTDPAREREHIDHSAKVGEPGVQVQIPLYLDSSLEYIAG